MIRVALPDNNVRRLPFFLAMEEWVAGNLPEGEYFFTWNVAPTVIVGHNQDLQAEVNLDYCREKGIDVVRRRSGGGAVYADRDNIMMSYISPQTDVESTFARYTGLVAAQLRKLGIDAEPSGRNDITVGGRKISGNAFYRLPGRSIVHGTMLFDTDMENMLNAITPSKAKLESHKVTSVESRITTVSRLMPGISLDDFHRQLTAGLETGRYEVTENDLAAIGLIEKAYYRPDWIMKGKINQSTIKINQSISGNKI